MYPPTDWPRSVWVRWEERQLLKQYAAMNQGLYSCTPRQFYTGNASAPRALLLAGRWLRSAPSSGPRTSSWRFGSGRSGRASTSSRAPDVLHYAVPQLQVLDADAVPVRTVRRGDGPREGHQHFSVRLLGVRAPSRLEPLADPRLRRAALAPAGRCGLFLAAVVADRIGLEQGASFALSAIFNVQYWQGASDELGGPAPVWSAVDEPRGCGRCSGGRSGRDGIDPHSSPLPEGEGARARRSRRGRWGWRSGRAARRGALPGARPALPGAGRLRAGPGLPARPRVLQRRLELPGGDQRRRRALGGQHDRADAGRRPPARSRAPTPVWSTSSSGCGRSVTTS